MTRRDVVSLAILGAGLAAILGVVWPWWVVLVAEVAVAGLTSWWAYTRHVSAELVALRRATVASDGLLLWEVRRHRDGRVSLSWARGAPLLAWRPEPHYVPDPSEEGPYTYWISTWDDPSGERDARIALALDTGKPQRWTASVDGRSYDTEAIRTSRDCAICITHDVTGAERMGAARGREELVSLARDLDAMRELHHA